MTGESNFFRKRFFGGFNKEDVVDYIAELAQERNDLAKAKEKAEKEIQALAHEVESLRLETEEARRLIDEDFEYKSSICKAAENTFEEFEAVFNGLHAEIETAAKNVLAELRNAGEITVKLPQVLSEAGERFNGLRAAFDSKNHSVDNDKSVEQG